VSPADGTIDFAIMYIPSESIYYDLVLRRKKESLTCARIAPSAR